VTRSIVNISEIVILQIDDIPDIERILHLRVFGQQRKTTRTGKMDQTEFTTHCLDSMRIEFEEDIKDKDERSVFKILKTKAEEEAKMIDLFSIHIESIEIVRDKEIQKVNCERNIFFFYLLKNPVKVYFPVGVQRKTLNQTRRDKVLWSVNRDSPNDKVFFFFCLIFFSEIKVHRSTTFWTAAKLSATRWFIKRDCNKTPFSA